MNDTLRCPVCSRILPPRPPCPCGFILRESDGILDFLGPAETPAHAVAYEEAQPHPATIAQLEAIVRPNGGGLAADVGAGNCWLTGYLDAWGFDAFAIDINTGGPDGLKAGQAYIDGGARFVRIRGAMERLPFADSRIRLLVANASLHYAKDFGIVLTEFRRVLEPAGNIVIINTPLTRKRLDESLRGLDLTYRMISVPPGFRRTYEKWRSRLLGRRIPELPVIVLQRQIS